MTVATFLSVSFWSLESLNLIFGSILEFQILAHMPLNDIHLPANSYQYFEMMIKIVSFDYFPIHEYIDFGFLETEAWSENFAWLDYDSINFIEGMGSINLFVWLIMLQAILVLLLFMLKCKIRFKFFKKIFQPM